MERGLAAPAALSQRRGPPSRAPHFLKALCREEPPPKSAFRLAVSFSELSVCPLLKPGEQRGLCPAEGCRGPSLPSVDQGCVRFL